MSKCSEAQYRTLARRFYGVKGEVEITEGADVLREYERGGAWVQAWIFIDDRLREEETSKENP